MKSLTRQSSAEGKKPADKMSLRFVLPMVLFYLIVGALLIWLKDQVTTIATYVLAVLLMVYGVWLTVRYFRSTVEERVAGKDLAFGLILLLAGIVLAFTPGSLQGILPTIWGLSLVFGGFLKIQYAFDEKIVGVKRWWIMLIFAAVSLIIGTLALLGSRVFSGDDSQTLFIIGIFMVGEAVLDFVTYLVISHGMKKRIAEKEPAVVYVPQPEPAPAPAQPDPAPAPVQPEPAPAEPEKENEA